MSKITKEQFLADVMHEIDMLKQRATPEEKARLDFDTIMPTHYDQCIYGQMTGDCTSPRAKDLMDQACTRVFNARIGYGEGVRVIKDKPIEDVLEYVNGEYKAQTWRDIIALDWYVRREFKYLSSLEGYITLKNANVAGVISYIKGETDTLEL